MPQFSTGSRQKLLTCHPDIQRVLEVAIRHIDFSVREGHRGQAAQNAAFAAGNSQLKWPLSKHNKKPSDAVDIDPYPVDFAESTPAIERYALLAGVVMTIADQMGVRLRWGGDWNRNQDTRDEHFRDRGHFERLAE